MSIEQVRVKIVIVLLLIEVIVSEVVVRVVFDLRNTLDHLVLLLLIIVIVIYERLQLLS